METKMFVIFGAYSNLAVTRLLVALYINMLFNKIPRSTRILLLGRKVPPDGWLNLVRDAVEKSYNKRRQSFGSNRMPCFDIELFNNVFWPQVRTFEMDFVKPEEYLRLKLFMNSIGRCSHENFFLSIDPDYFTPVVNGLRSNELLHSGSTVIAEKPIGLTYRKARDFVALIGSLGVRVVANDHYGFKPLTAEYLERRCKAGLEEIWNGVHLKNLSVTAAETVLADGRGYYENAGQLKDMFPHIARMLTDLAGNIPGWTSGYNDQTPNQARLEFMKSLTIPNPEKTVLGKYEGFAGKGPTFFGVGLNSNLERWNRGRRPTQFFIRSGKGLRQKTLVVAATMRRPQLNMKHLQRAQTVFYLDNGPFEEVRFKDGEIQSVHRGIEPPLDDAYDRVVARAVNGEWDDFQGLDEALEAIRIIEPLDQVVDSLTVHPYRVGSWGPEAINELFSGWPLHERQLTVPASVPRGAPSELSDGVMA